jgi:cytochrome b561
MTVIRYPRSMVILHWLLAVLILLTLIAGRFLMDPIPNDSPDKAVALSGHMVFATVILVLMILRLTIRLRSDLPPHVNLAATAAHWGLYGLIFLMLASGIVMSVHFGLINILFLGEGTLPESFDTIGARAVHGIASTALIALIALHIAAAIYHVAVKKDGVMSRMGFRR